MKDEYELIEDRQHQSSPNIFKAIQQKMTEFMFQKQQKDQSSPIIANKYKKPAFLVDDMKNCFINLNQSFEYVGDNSTFQKRITTILVVQWIAFSFMVNSMAFFFRSPTFLCRVPLTDFYIHCSQSIACEFENTDFLKVVYESTGFLHTFSQVSITQDFHLICENASEGPFAQSLFFLGGFLSGYLFSYVSSIIGRRSILLIINVLSIISICLCAIAPTFSVFLIGYFLCGFCLFGYETSVYIYIGQISAIRFRTISINMLTMVFAGTPILLPFLSLIPTWRYSFLLFAILLVGTLPFSYKCFLESPRFLVAKQCYSQARQIFEKISVTNRRPPYKFRLVEEIQTENKTYLKYQQKHESYVGALTHSLLFNKVKSYNFLDLFKYKSIRKTTIVLMYWWMFKFFMYFGLNLALESIIRSGLYLTLMIASASLMQVLGSFGITIMTTFLYKRHKLNVMKASIFITTMCCLGMIFLQIDIECKVLLGSEGQLCFQLILMILFVLLIKFFNTVFFSGLITYSSEVYPTPVRSLGCGFTLTFGRLGTIIVPYYIGYMKIQYPTKNSLCWMAPFGIVAYFLCCFMPHTEDEGLKDYLVEEEQKKMIQLHQLK